MANGKPDYIVSFPKIDKRGETHWKQIGVAFNQQHSRAITVILDAQPLDWGEGVLSLYPMKDHHDEPAE